VERAVPWGRTQHCWKCIQLGAVLSLVSLWNNIHVIWFHLESIEATTCSRNEPRVMTRTSVCRQAHTFSVLPKQVRHPLPCLNFFHSNTPLIHRYGDGNHYEPNLGGQSTHVHNTSRFTNRISKFMGSVLCRAAAVLCNL
jgi:hypothetical protein